MKRNTKRTIGILLILGLILGLGSCSKAVEPPAAETVTLKVGATPTPHAEVLEQTIDILKEKGVVLEIVEFTDYTTINPALESGDLDVNYFQHSLYLNDFNEKNSTTLTSAGKVHYEPYGLYGGKNSSLEELEDGATIAVPNDATNEARALLLLEQAGLIKLKEGVGILATIHDIEENPHNLDIVELAAEQIPWALEDVHYAVINGNYAISAGLNVATDSLVIEAADGEAGEVYANVVAVKEERLNEEAVKALLEVLGSDAIRTWIQETYEGAVLPIK